jgi:DNA-binding winged helix-turn-helix (wHTH) protein
VNDAKTQRRLFRFGMFELDAATGELRKEGKSRPRIRDQALQILTMLLEKPEDLVTREELRERLWSADTFVDFDHGLNTSMNQIRNALGDSASNPRFIQTLPRRGYRFIAPVQIVSAETTAVSVRDMEEAEHASASGRAESRSLLSDAADLPVIRNKWARILFGLIQIMYLGFYVVSLARLTMVEAILVTSENFFVTLLVALIVTAAVGIPIRLYLLTAAALNYRGLTTKFLKIFPLVLVLDELWALAPFLLVQWLGVGLAIASTAVLLYVPFSQRSLLLMGSKNAD